MKRPLALCLVAAALVAGCQSYPLSVSVSPRLTGQVLDADTRAPLSAGEQLFQRKLKLNLKFDRAMTMTEGPEHHFRFIRLHMDLRMEENRLKILER